MKKLFWSAFAMSLIFQSLIVRAQTEGVDDFLGLETEIMPELAGEQAFTAPDLHESPSLRVKSQNVVQDVVSPNKGQNFSIIPWSTMDTIDWLSINTWLLEREIKDKTPDWKIRLRQADHKELVGKFIQCKGTCSVYRGSNKADTQYLSRILEGDEVKTEKDSVAWIYFMDGSLLKLSPETSLSIHEFNIGKSQIFVQARLNQGHIFWHPRNKADHPLELSPETDAFSLPLMIRSANQQFYERKIFESQTDFQRVSEVMNLDEQAIKDQIFALNKLKQENNLSMNIPTKFMLVSPNATIVSSEASFDYYYVPGGNTYFKKRTFQLGEEFSLHLRGYTDTSVNTISEMAWYEVDSNGRSFSQVIETPGVLQVTELLTKRIKTLELAREIWVKEFTVPMMNAVSKPELLARNYGYSLWGEELSKRYNFLVEYTRRIETTNLRSLENLLVKLENAGETVKRDLSEDHYRVSLNHYLLGLKSRYDSKKMRVREMNELQYYVWILKNGKW